MNDRQLIVPVYNGGGSVTLMKNTLDVLVENLRQGWHYVACISFGEAGIILIFERQASVFEPAALLPNLN